MTLQDFKHKNQQDLPFLRKRSSWLLGELEGRGDSEAGSRVGTEEADFEIFHNKNM